MSANSGKGDRPGYLRDDEARGSPVVSLLMAKALLRFGDASTGVPDGVFVEEVAEEERQRRGGWVVLLWDMRCTQALGDGLPLFHQVVEKSWFWVKENWQRVVDDPELKLDVSSFYGLASK
ncbi:Uncharacterized protein Adt_41846 [Abeliophyllum distichum]|uniref:Uncharacterized protein n=1 Tax=Abeliophyllum distichum TaxID=126358 RepID=A0ABD1PQ02_9LAMI